MNQLTIPGTQLAPLEQGRGDGVGRLARRTQRGQGKRRLLVGGLIALSVLLGVASAIFAATMVESDETVGLVDQFGEAQAVASTFGVGTVFVGGAPSPTVEDLTDAQRTWLEANALDGPLPATATGDPAQLPLEVQQGLGLVPVTVDPAPLLTTLDLAVDEVLVEDVLETWDPATESVRVVTTLDVTHPLAGGTYDVGGRGEPLAGEQALLSPALLGSLGASVGDRVELPQVGTVEVVGTATRAFARSDQVAILAPDRELAPDSSNEGNLQTRVRFADVAGARAYQEAAANRTDELLAALPEPTAEQAETAGIPAEELDAMQPYANTGEVLTREDYLAFSQGSASLGAIVGGTVTSLATVVAAIVGACAFAVGIRRRIREIGMLGAIGTTPSQLRRLLRREGLVIGLGGALVGAAAGLALSLAGQPLVERLVDRDLAIVFPVVGTALPVVVGGLGAYLAAVWPARTAARVPITTALAGRVPLGSVPRWLPVAGAVAAVTGVALLAQLATSTGNRGTGVAALQLLVAVLLATLGTAALGVPVVALGGRIADRLPLLGRLALRDAARQRTRSAAAIAALVPVLAVPVAGLATTLSTAELYNGPGAGPVTEDGTRLEQLPYDDPGGARFALVGGPYVEGRQPPPSSSTVDRVLAQLPPAADRAPVTWLGAPDLTGTAQVFLPYTSDGRIAPGEGDLATLDRYGAAFTDQVALATPALLDLLGLPADAVPTDGGLLVGTSGVELPDDLTELQVLQYEEADTEMNVDASLSDAAAADLPRGEQFPTHRELGTLELEQVDTDLGGITPGVLVTPATAERLDLVPTAAAELVALERVPTAAEANAAYEIAFGPDGAGLANLRLAAEPYFWSTPLGIAIIVAIAGLVVVLGVSVVAGMTSALAATESDGDVRKAVALGAAPALRRQLHGIQAWWHTAIAVVLGSGLGLAIAWAYVRTQSYQVESAEGQLTTITGELVVPWLGLVPWVLLLPVLVGGVIALVMRSAQVGAPKRRTA